jgi:hypothetical protein
MSGYLKPGRYVVLSDIQWPYHDAKALRAVLAFVRDVKPAGVLNVGDELDQDTVSHWNKGTAREFSPVLRKDIRDLSEWTENLRKALGDGPIHISRSNHGDRLQKYVNMYAPALVGFEELEITSLLRYPELGVTYHRKPFEFAPGWVLAHGDEGNLSRIAGSTALNLAKKWGKSVICGHTHRAGITHESTGVNGSLRTLTGFEVGNLMSLKKAGYLKAQSANWQQGVGLLDIDDRLRVVPSFVPIRNGELLGAWT